MALIITTLSRAIDEFRKLYLANSISPETVGFLLKQIVDHLEKIMAFLDGAMDDEVLANILKTLEENNENLMKWYILSEGMSPILGSEAYAEKDKYILNLLFNERQQDNKIKISYYSNLIEAATSSKAGVMTADMFNAFQAVDNREIFPACPMLQQEHLLYMKPGLKGYSKIRSSQIDGLGDGTEIIVFELDGTQSISNGVGLSLIFRDTSIVRYKTQISGNDTFDWEFDCVVRQNGQLYTAKVSVITARSTGNAGYEVRSVRIRKF